MNAVWMLSTVEPVPTFSPSLVQYRLTSLGRFMLWEMPPAAAMFADQRRATEVSSPLVASALSPCETRSWLVRARNRASSEPGSAWAGLAAATDRPPTSSTTAQDAPSDFPSSRRHIAFPFRQP